MCGTRVLKCNQLDWNSTSRALLRPGMLCSRHLQPHPVLPQPSTVQHLTSAAMFHVALCVVVNIVTIYGQSHKLHLDVNTTLNWKVHYQAEVVEFEVRTKTDRSALHWFGVGFSDYGELNPSDMCILWMDYKGRTYLQDTWVSQKGTVQLDKKQDCNDFQITKKHDGTLAFYFLRPFDTCDNHDYVIEDGTTHIVWMKGDGALYGVDGLDITSARYRGFQRTTLLYSDAPAPAKSPDTFTLDIRAKNTKVPSEETTYWCTIIKLPDKLENKHHVIQYEKAFAPNGGDLVHHMEIFHCATEPSEIIPPYEGLCHDAKRPNKTMVCSRVIAAWAMGAPPFIYPEKAGLPIGGPDYNQYVMLEVHYHNPEKIAGTIDTSGFRLYLTQNLRNYDAGIMELGLEYNDKMAIPPRQESFLLSGFCISECTAVGLPARGITVFGSQLHTHLTGVRVFTKHVRNSVELPELNRDNHYSQHLQEIRRLKHHVKLLPGDALITTCQYRTVDRENVTLTGFAITDEMCVNYIHYYPATDLEVCKSSIPDENLNKYFQHMALKEGQDIRGDQGISTKYRQIKWNAQRVEDIQHLFLNSPVSMQCNQSSGHRFPGGWEGLNNIRIDLPLPPKQRECGLYRDLPRSADVVMDKATN